MTKDPICGKEVDPLRARAVGIFGGVTYYFCSPECKSKYVDPRKVPREPNASRPVEKNPAPVAAAAQSPAPARPAPSAQITDEVDAINPSPGGSRTWIAVALLVAAVGIVAYLLSHSG